MENQPIRDRRVLEAMEACRHGSDDLADPELQFLAVALESDPELQVYFARLQRADETIAETFVDVPVPEGLENRLLAVLGVAGLTAEAATAAEPVAAVEAPSPAPSGQRRSRRWLVTAAVATAASVLVGAVLLPFLPSEPTYDRQTALVEAIRLFQAENAAPPAGKPLPGPQAYPLSSKHLRATPRASWRPVSLLGSRGVAYDLRLPGARATLYVLHSDLPNLPPRPPQRPTLSTAGHSSATWREGELTYILVVPGGQDAYQRFLLHTGPRTIT